MTMSIAPRAPKSVCGAALVVAALLVGSTATATAISDEADTAAEATESRGTFVLRGGVSGYGFSQSLTPEHLIRPTVRIELGYEFFDGLILGVEAFGTVTANENYQLAGGLLIGRARIVEAGIYSLWFGWGAGAGTNPRIVARDLVATNDVGLLWQLGLHQRFELVDDLFFLGFDLFAENLSVVTTTLGLGFRY